MNELHIDTALARGMRELFSQLEKRLGLTGPLRVYVAGGMAAYLYTASRVSADVDAEFSARIHVPSDLIVNVTLEDGSTQAIYFDTNYNPTFALMHEDYVGDAVPVGFGLNHVQVFVLSPVDLAVSKIARLADPDRQDIAQLVRCGLTTADEIQKRAEPAINYFVGGRDTLRLNLRDALAIAREAEPKPDKPDHPKG